VAFSFLTEDNFKKLWDASSSYMEDLRKPYDEFERVKNNRPHPSIDPAYPKTTDGTTASQVRLTPRRAIQQVPYGTAKVEGDEALTCLSNFLLQDEIIPHSDTQDNVLGKTWKGVEDIETYGSTDALVFYKNDGEYFGSDWRVPYKKDIYLEAGKGTFSECNYIFVRAWYQDSDIQAIIDKEASLAKAAKERKEEYEATWDTILLQKLLDEGQKSDKDEKAKTDSEKDRNLKTKSYELVHGLQKGAGAKFFTFALAENKPARTWVNPDPRGVIPLHRMYFECDLSNPEGRGIVELVAPLQNYLDSCLQSQQYTKAVMYAPPLIKKGSFNRSQIQLVPNAVIDLGTDPNNSLTPLSLANSTLANFGQDYGLIKSQILNLFGGDDQSVSSTVGNPGFSKTDAGVNARQAIVGVNDNFIRKRVETWLGEIFCTQLNLYFAITQGDREFTPDEDELAKLAEYESEYFTVQDDKVIVHFSNIQDKQISFETEASTSKAPDTNEDKEHFLDAMKTAAELGLGQYINPQEAAKRLLVQSGVNDPEKLIVDPAEQQMGQDPNAQPQDPQDQQILQNLIQSGYPPQVAQQALALEKQGYSHDQIDQILKQQAGGQ
jgi:hypothetical protein